MHLSLVSKQDTSKKKEEDSTEEEEEEKETPSGPPRCPEPRTGPRSPRSGRLPRADFISSSLFAFPAPQKILDDDTRARAVTVISLFNGVVWFEHSYYFKMMSAPSSTEEAINWLASTAALDHISAFDLKQVRIMGRADTGTRTPAQVQAARAYGFQSASWNPSSPGPAASSPSPMAPPKATLDRVERALTSTTTWSSLALGPRTLRSAGPWDQ